MITWRTCTLSEKYEVSDDGRVRRVWKHTHRELKPYDNGKGYMKVQLGYRGPRTYVHALVAAAFIGPRPPGRDIDHRDFDRTNNAVSNLRYLPSPINSVRWAGREYRADGTARNLWMLIRDEPPPDDWVGFTLEEQEAVLDEIAAAGW